MTVPRREDGESRWRALWVVPWQAARNFVDDDCTMLAAAIAFYSLLSLAPSLYLVGLALSAVFEDASTSQRIVAIIAEFLPSEALPTVENVSRALTVRGSLLVVALPGLLWIATQAVHALQVALNVAFARKPHGSAVWGTRLKSFVVLIAGAGLLGVLLFVETAVTILQWFSTRLGLRPAGLALTDLLSSIAMPLLTFLVFHLFYRLLPTGRCKRGPAALGALIAMILWLGARQMFGLFVAHSPGFGIVTGTLAGVLAFLVSIYTGVMLVLYGAEIAAMVNGDRPT